MSATGFTGIVVIVLFVGLMVFFSFINKDRKTYNIRPIPAYDKIIQEINVAVEDGSQLHISLGSGGITGSESAAALAGLSILKQVIEKSSVCDHPPVASTGNPVISILAQDTIIGILVSIPICPAWVTITSQIWVSFGDRNITMQVGTPRSVWDITIGTVDGAILFIQKIRRSFLT